MKNLIYILNILMILIFASCKDENAFMPGDDEICYTLSVSIPNDVDTRATYDDRGSTIAVKWEKGDVVVLKVGTAEYSFLYRSSNSTGEIGEFYHYGKIPGDDNLPDGAVLSFGNVVDGQNKTFRQVQKKNNVCGEYLTASMSGVDLTAKPTVDLYPEDGYSLLHLQVKSPGMLIGGSKLVIKGLDKTNDYEITLGDPSSVFADNGDLLDIYLIVAKDLKISQGTNLDFYLYAYDEKTGQAGTAKEYHYYMRCNATISVGDKEVLKLGLPNKPKRLIHFHSVAPVDLLSGSLLKVHGWDNELKVITLSELSEGDEMDMYIELPSSTPINKATTLKFYIYAYDNDLKNAENGDEYHYYVDYNGAEDNEVIEMPFQAPDYVALQMGLSVKWSPVNIGATDRAETGTYFAWGEIAPAPGGDYSSSNCKAYNMNWNTLYINGYVDKGAADGILVPKYDAATQNWGDDWKIPTRSDFQELMDNCSYEMTKPGDYFGFEFTSKKNGKKIFFANGGQWEGKVDKTTVEAWKNYSGKRVSDFGRGQYWVSNVAIKDDPVRGCAFTSVKSNSGNFSDEPNFQDQNRSYGRLVRPVRKSN